MNIERMSADGLTRETWEFDWRALKTGNAPCWVCICYDRAVRAKKTHKTWKLVATSSPDYVAYRWSEEARHGMTILTVAPIDDALIAEVRRRAAEAPVVGRRA